MPLTAYLQTEDPDFDVHFITTEALAPEVLRRRSLTICSDGSVPRNPIDLTGRNLLGTLADSSLREIWQRAISDE